MFNNNYVYNLIVIYLFDCGVEVGVVYILC